MRCASAYHPAFLSIFLPCVEYANNLRVRLPLKCFHLLPALVIILLCLTTRRMRWLFPRWRPISGVAELEAGSSALLRSSHQSQKQANQCRSRATLYHPSQKVWFCSKDLPLQVDSQKLAPRFFGDFEVDKVVNSSAVCLKLPLSLKEHSSFHMSLLKPVSKSDLVTPCLINGSLTYTIWRILNVRHPVLGGLDSVVPKSNHNFRVSISSMMDYWGTIIRVISQQGRAPGGFLCVCWGRRGGTVMV